MTFDNDGIRDPSGKSFNRIYISNGDIPTLETIRLCGAWPKKFEKHCIKQSDSLTHWRRSTDHSKPTLV